MTSTIAKQALQIRVRMYYKISFFGEGGGSPERVYHSGALFIFTDMTDFVIFTHRGLPRQRIHGPTGLCTRSPSGSSPDSTIAVARAFPSTGRTSSLPSPSSTLPARQGPGSAAWGTSTASTPSREGEEVVATAAVSGIAGTGGRQVGYGQIYYFLWESKEESEVGDKI